MPSWEDRTMPELPDVEGFKRYLKRHAGGRRVQRVEVLDRTMLRNATAPAFGRAVTGHQLARPRRHGKWLLCDAGDATVLMHFGMTGLLKWGEEAHAHDRIVFSFADGRLSYRNMRKFGGVWLARGEREARTVTGPLGPDAMDLSRERFEEILAPRRGGVKAALMDQRLIAGLGNLLADEILWRARIHPRRDTRTLDERDRARMHRIMRDVLIRSNRRARVPPLSGWLTGARDAREPECPRCGSRLQKATVAGRTACWCPSCQGV
jgi:formamidopyrimidine-DNA glycosylase